MTELRDTDAGRRDISLQHKTWGAQLDPRSLPRRSSQNVLPHPRRWPLPSLADTSRHLCLLGPEVSSISISLVDAVPCKSPHGAHRSASWRGRAPPGHARPHLPAFVPSSPPASPPSPPLLHQPRLAPSCPAHCPFSPTRPSDPASASAPLVAGLLRSTQCPLS